MKKKSINNIIVITVGLILVLAFTNNNNFNHLNDYLDKKNQYFRENLELSDYSSFIEGEDINITLHQSLLDTSLISISNVSDSANNTFYEPCPTDPTFNSSYTEFLIEDIYAPNKTLIIETNTTNTKSLQYDDHALSFQVPNNCTLYNLTICFSEQDLLRDFDAVVDIELWSASWNTNFNDWGPNVAIATLKNDLTIYNDTSTIWYNISNINLKIDTSDTNNNTFFIFLTQNTSPSLAVVAFHNEIDGLCDDSSVWRYSGGWQPVPGIDPSMVIHLLPLNNTPTPSEIYLKINNSAINDIGDENKGYWFSTEEYAKPAGQLEFELSADWWDVSCNITKVQINYTKTDLKASSKFTIMESGQDVQWNVTRSGGLIFFDPRITHHNTINFTIPATWLNINAFNGPENKTSDIKTRLLNNGYRDVEIIDATNGTFWYLTATSKNLVESIDMYIGSNPINMANYPDVVEFNVTFNKIIGQNDGVINLCVYSPAAINNKLNFTSVNSTFDSGSEFYLGKWDLSDTVMEYGKFRVQVFWNNDTAAGFREKILTITGQTDFTLITPSQEATYYSNQSFNIVVYYKDSNQLKAIDGATIQYNINGQGWQSTSSNNGTIGYYIIPVNCSIFTINGTKTVEITASKNYYESQTLDYNFNVIISEEKGKQGEEFPLVIIIITIISTVGGIGVATVTIVLLRKRKRISKGT